MPPSIETASSPTIDGVLLPVEDVAEFCASRFHWTYQQTMSTPAWLVWRLYRTEIRRAEEAKRGNHR